MHMTLRQLSYFVEAARAGSISKAAERLNVTPTALSLQIRELEEQSGAALLRRHSRGIETTSAGAGLYERAVEILRLVEEASRALCADSPPRRLRVGAPPPIARLIGVDSMLASGQRLSGVEVDMIEGWTVDMEARLEGGELDVVIGYDLKPTDKAVVTDIVDDALVFIAAPELAGGRGAIPLAEVLASDLIFYGEQSVSYRGARSLAEATGLTLASHRHVYSINVWCSMLVRGLATSIGSIAAVYEEQRRGEVAIREIEGNPIRPRIGIAVHASIANEPWGKAFVRLASRLVIDGLIREHKPPATDRVVEGVE